MEEKGNEVAKAEREVGPAVDLRGWLLGRVVEGGEGRIGLRRGRKRGEGGKLKFR